MKTGFIISGLAHGGLIVWLLFGGLFMPAPEAEFVDVAQVSILSEAEFAALSAPPPQPSVAPQVAPPPPPRPEPPAPESVPEIVSGPAPAPEMPEPQPSPPAPESAPADIDRVAPEAAPEPSPNVEIAPETTPEVAPGERGDVTLPESAPTAPEAATTEIVTEATETADLAPARAPRPPMRPARPAPASESAAAPVADAVAEAVAEATSAPLPAAPPSTAPVGPPLSSAEKRAFRVAVGNCWNVGSLSSEALATTVVVAVSMTPAGKPEIGSIRMVSFSGGSERAARRAFDAARRAIIRCGASGYDLPSDKYAQWKEIEMTFNPENMRIK